MPREASPSPTPPTDFASLIDLFGGASALAAVGDFNTRTVQVWRANNWIPPRRWKDVVRVAKECGFEGIKYALLAGFPRPDNHDVPESEF